VEYLEIPIKNAVKLMDGEYSTIFFSCSFIGDRVLNKAILFYRNYLSSVLIQEIFLTLDHDDLSQRAKVRNTVLRKQNLFLLPRFSNPSYELRII
jgi:hypothetical protein